MICCKVQHGENVLVIVNLRAVCQNKAHALEYFDDFILDNCQRMTRSKSDRIGCAGEVYVIPLCLFFGKFFPQTVDFVGCRLLEFIDFYTDILLLVCCNVAEISHKSVDFTFLAKIFKTQLFYVLCILCSQTAYFF